LANLVAALLICSLLLAPTCLARPHAHRGHDLHTRGSSEDDSSRGSSTADRLHHRQPTTDESHAEEQEEESLHVQQQQQQLLEQLLHERQLLLQLLDVEARLAADGGQQLTKLSNYK
jgi:hypothetical protein